VLEQRVHHEARVVRHVLHQHAQQVVHLAGQRRTLDHLGPGLDRGAEQLDRAALLQARVLFEPDVEHRGQAEADPLGLDQRHVAGDDPGLLEPLDAAQRRRSRQADGRGELVVGHPAVGLERTKNAPIDRIELHHG
jgi:hypothetical protein